MAVDNLVYFDMDGVLANFDSAYDSLVGRRKPNNDVYWEEIVKIPDFYLCLPLMPLAKELVSAVPEPCRRILSSVPKSIDVASNQKRSWLKKNFNLAGDSIILVHGKQHKKEYARPGDILVDDLEQNINDWNIAGGTGLLYIFPNTTLARLQELVKQL